MTPRIRVTKLLAAAGVALAGTGTALAAGPLVNPTGDVMCLLYYRLANQPAPLGDYAEQAATVRNANEFDRQKAIDTEKARLKALQASLAAVSSIRVTIDMSMGEYDSDLGEYDLSGFSPDEYLPFQCFDRYQVRLRFDNAPDAQSWALDPKAAEAALDRNEKQRDIAVVATVALAGVDSAAPGDPLVLVGDVTEVSVLGEYNHAPLGHYAVKAQ